MNDPFSGIPDPGTPRPIRKRSQPGVLQEALRDLEEALRAARPKAQGALRRGQRLAKDTLRGAQRYGKELWFRGKRNPRTVSLIGGALALSLVGAFAVSASGAGRSLCPPTSAGKAPKFLVLMDSVPQVAAGSNLEIHYDVCGLTAGTAYRGRVRIAPLRAVGKKKSARPKPLVVSFKDQVEGVATRRQQELKLGSTKPGAYTLELLVTDSKGRERKKVQKMLVKGR